MEQLKSDIYAQNWDALYDPKDHIPYFNAIIMWLLELLAPLRKYIWYRCEPTFDVEKAMIERNIAYRIWKRRNTAANRTRYKELRRQVNYLVRKSKRLYMKRFLDPNLPAKKLWRNLNIVGMK
jgi:hypothetical protein